mmetsp:Transcript_62384/g.180866  ORF Transcript_62384/g.180866 Transcript_62384/m.180866 type:complete len:227 (-) Transcript_62384:257-937(-)
MCVDEAHADARWERWPMLPPNGSERLNEPDWLPLLSPAMVPHVVAAFPMHISDSCRPSVGLAARAVSDNGGWKAKVYVPEVGTDHAPVSASWSTSGLGCRESNLKWRKVPPRSFEAHLSSVRSTERSCGKPKFSEYTPPGCAYLKRTRCDSASASRCPRMSQEATSEPTDTSKRTMQRKPSSPNGLSANNRCLIFGCVWSESSSTNAVSGPRLQALKSMHSSLEFT